MRKAPSNEEAYGLIMQLALRGTVSLRNGGGDCVVRFEWPPVYSDRTPIEAKGDSWMDALQRTVDRVGAAQVIADSESHG